MLYYTYRRMADYKIVIGHGNYLLGPDDKITRRQATIIICRANKYYGVWLNLFPGVAGRDTANFGPIAEIRSDLN